MTSNRTLKANVFPTRLGWISIVWDGDLVHALSFGHKTEIQGWQWVAKTCEKHTKPAPNQRKLMRRLQAFAEGEADQFLDVQIDLRQATPFQRQVVDQCRRIPWGETMTYGELAAKAGQPRAARAVGSVMSKNRFPLIVPCHRVVGAARSLGGYSAPDGLQMKMRLLRLEGHDV